jgi:uncharacterized protein YpmB
MSENIVPPTQPLGGSVPPPKKKRRIGKIIGIVFAVFVVVIVAVTMFVNSATKAPLAVSDQFLNAMQAGDATTAYDLFSTQAKTTVTPDQFAAIVKQVGPILNTQEKVTNKKVNGQTGSAATSEITYEVKGTDGKTYAVIVNLTKDGAAWKVMNFDSKLK